MSEPVFSSQNSAGETKPAPVGVSARKPAHVIIVGNEKGGSGKTTTTMHLIVALLRLGFTVGSMDIDARQRSLSRYIENRRQTIAKESQSLPLPHHIIIQKSPFHLLQEAEADERERFLKGLSRIYYSNDFVVIDTPGSDTYLARLAHSFADTVITPINDSFVDLDVLANVDGQTMKVVKPSIYSEMVWEQKLTRAKRDGGAIEWIVMRNRLSNIDARNKRHMTQVLGELSRRIGFRVAPGFSERVIFREMFLQGLTVLDVLENGSGGNLSLSHVAARQEVRELLKTLRIPVIDERVTELRALQAEKGEGSEPGITEIAPAATPAEPKMETPVTAKAEPVAAEAARKEPAEQSAEIAGTVTTSVVASSLYEPATPAGTGAKEGTPAKPVPATAAPASSTVTTSTAAPLSTTPRATFAQPVPLWPASGQSAAVTPAVPETKLPVASETAVPAQPKLSSGAGDPEKETFGPQLMEAAS